MRSPIQVFRDWTQVRKLKEGFVAAMRVTPIGNGITITEPGDPIVARAVNEFLLENPQYEILDYGFEVSIKHKQTMATSVSNKMTYDRLKSRYDVIDRDALVTLGYAQQAQLPPRRFRDGVPLDLNGQPEAANVGTTVDPASLIVKP